MDAWNDLTHRSQYLALRGVAALVHSFFVEQNLHTAAAVGTLFNRFNAGRRQRARDNIARSFPEWSDRRVDEITERSMQYMFQLFMVDAMVAPRLVTPSTWPQYVQLRNVGPMFDRLLRGKPVIMLTGHCGNWELLGQLLAVIGYPVVALARPLDNPYLNRWFMGIREARGTRIITKWGATPILQETLEGGGRLGFIADQNAGDRGVFVPFFGRLASSYKSIGVLALRYGVPIIAATARRIGTGFRYELDCTDFFGPEDWDDQPDPLYYITARYNRAIEQMIREAPEQYLWLHRRWKSRPRFERDGKPPPKPLIEKLETLPWMTQTELDRIIAASAPGAAQSDGRV